MKRVKQMEGMRGMEKRKDEISDTLGLSWKETRRRRRGATRRSSCARCAQGAKREGTKTGAGQLYETKWHFGSAASAGLPDREGQS